jgi:protease-4
VDDTAHAPRTGGGGAIDEYLGLFRVLEENRRIKGVMLEMESPGGSSTASECLFHRLKRLNEKKPLYCYALMAASGGYMAAAAARKIYASSTALVGSIGVLSVKPVLREFMEKVGVNLEVMKKGAMKDMTLFHRESTEEERRSWEALHEEIYARFIDLVAGARALEREKVAAIASGELPRANSSAPGGPWTWGSSTGSWTTMPPWKNYTGRPG